MKNLMIAVFVSLLVFGCSSQKTTSNSDDTRGQQARPEGRPPGGGQEGGQRGGQRGAPSFAQLLTEMDANQDGRLAKSEVKGPILNDFAKIDTDGNGFISKEELENAPRPQRGERPPRN